MPRKPKEEIVETEKIVVEAKTSSATKKTPVKKTTKKEETTKQEKSKKATASKKSVAINSDKINEEKVIKKSKTTSKKEIAIKPEKDKIVERKPIKKNSTASNTTKKTTSKKASTTKSKTIKKKIDILEYYDLPYRYNQTIVKVLAQTPTTLYIYWDISDEEKKNYVSQYGENFFSTTKPVLIIHNQTMNYSYEIEINDFANSWYLHVEDSNCKYGIELGRRPIVEGIHIPNNYQYITSSNVIDAPNDRILFDKMNDTIYFKDVKTNITTNPKVASLSFMRNMGKLYHIYESFYPEELKDVTDWQLDLTNPSSSNPTSTFR